MKRKTWIGFGGGLLAVVGVATYFAAKPKDEVRWRTVKVDKGNVTQRISATGTVNAMVQVAVGTQVSGVISALYVDYNSLVKKGQLIAQIDSTVWQTQLQDAQASLLRAQAAYDFAQADYDRSRRLAADKLLADQDLDTKVTALKTAKGNLESAKATVDRAKANLGYCNITAPVDGVVISRLADVGQTVAASFSTPNLFQIAQDLSKMKVQISVDESDIDQVKVGQRAFFTVDSLPEKQFVATVSQVRLEPITNSNVVTYNVVMEVPNEPLPGSEHAQSPAETDPEKAWERAKDRLPEGTTKAEFLARFKARMAERAKAAASAAPRSAADRLAAARTPGGAGLVGGPTFSGNLALRPGMTANVTILTNQRKDVLRVPNAALRFNPAAFMKEEKKSESSGRPGGAQARPAQRPGGSASGMVARREDHVWILENGKPKAIPVKAGISDGQFTEVSGEGLQEGQAVLVGVEEQKSASNANGARPLGGPRGMH
ncbi:MAG TPA: efflux RND transporter periplasmic adaptor subunit [Holophagaceae bacterium]